MYTGLPYSALELLCILHHLGNMGLLFANILHLFAILEDIFDIHLGSFAIFVFVLLKRVGNKVFQCVHFGQRHLLNASYVGDCKFCSHSSVIDDMCYALFAIFVGNPFEYFGQTVVVEVDIYIG